MVQRVLASSHSADYKLEDLPSDVRRDTVIEEVVDMLSVLCFTVLKNMDS